MFYYKGNNLDVITTTCKRFDKRFDNGCGKHKNKIIMEIGKSVSYSIREGISYSYGNWMWNPLADSVSNVIRLMVDTQVKFLIIRTIDLITQPSKELLYKPLRTYGYR